VSPNPPSIAQRFDHDFFATAAKALRAAGTQESAGGAGPSGEARRAVEQFFSDGLAGGEIIDLFGSWRSMTCSRAAARSGSTTPA
jgi:hypothetical protein